MLLKQGFLFDKSIFFFSKKTKKCHKHERWCNPSSLAAAIKGFPWSDSIIRMYSSIGNPWEFLKLLKKSVYIFLSSVKPNWKPTGKDVAHCPIMHGIKKICPAHMGNAFFYINILNFFALIMCINFTFKYFFN